MAKQGTDTETQEEQEETKKKSGWWRIGAIVLVVIALFIASRFLPVGEWLQQFNKWVEDLGPAGMAVYALVYAIATVLMLPGSVFTIAAGVIFGLGWGYVVVAVGSVTGAALAFLVGRYVARSTVEQKLAGKPKFDAIDRAIGREGWKIVLMLRLSPVIPFNLQNYFYGLTKIKFWPYVLATWIGMIPGTLLYVYLGVIGKKSLEAAAGADTGMTTLEKVFFGVGLLVTIAVTIYVTRLANKALKETEVAEAAPEDNSG